MPDITEQVLVAKEQEYADAAETHRTSMNANLGALQAVRELLAMLRAPAATAPKTK